MPFKYPISLDVTGRRCVVIGGGDIGERKSQELLEAGADVVVIAPYVTAEIEKLSEGNRLALIRREYAPGDLEGAFVAIAATDNRDFNSRIFQEATERNVLLNAVDDIGHCHFAAPSIVRRGDLSLAISTAGKAPALARRLREQLGAQFGPEWGFLVDLLGEVREETLPRRQVDFPTWVSRWQQALDHDLIGMIAAGNIEEARECVREALEGDGSAPHQPPAGKVSIVGAGPGDPGLITVRGKELVNQANVVVHDRLVNSRLFDGKDSIPVGKEPGHHRDQQDEINKLLIRLAQEGKQVVRLKGGDPFVFGRGAEEAEALADAGVDYEIVPAPSAATAVPAYAGIPVTDRRWSSSVAVVTGHCVTGAVDWAGMARSVETIVVLMGMARLAEIVDGLLEGGLDPTTPAAVIENGTLPEQRVITASLGKLPSAAEEAGVSSPATIVVGEVVTVRDRIAWFTDPAKQGDANEV
jgi:uroporphyrin-III C-methyltransferase/precorrin-2 dehydrogenase/sirohydrochlorin ferrochelatase